MSQEHKSIHKQHMYLICSNSQQYIVWVKMIIFSIMQKIITILRSCYMKIKNFKGDFLHFLCNLFSFQMIYNNNLSFEN